jgi:hypothetical protein
MKKSAALLLCLTFVIRSFSQITPEITSWQVNTTGQKGYDSILTNVQIVQYSTDNVYISCTCIPGYDIGPWGPDPNIPANQNFVFQITRNPVQNTGTPVAVPLGHDGVWSNGVSIFNASDGMTYNNDNVWHRNAYIFEGNSFDDCLGHPQQTGEYHHHVSPTCLYNMDDSTHHSPIIGYMFDGFPVYGIYGYADTNGTGGIRRMRPSYQLRNITMRDTLPNGTAASVAGPAVSASYPLGDFLEDYIYVPGSGDLDEHNGRFCVTPDYPNGIYAYFVTVDSTLTPAYPYTAGPTYYGTVNLADLGPTSGHVTITEATTIYSDTGATAINSINSRNIKFQESPNPTKGYAFIYFDPASENNITGTLYSSSGQLLQTIHNLQPSISYSLDLTKYAAGTYYLHLETPKNSVVQKIVKVGN